MKVYLASKYSTGKRIREYEMQLRGMGIWPVSQWYRTYAHASPAKEAARDLADVAACDVFVLFTKPRSVTGGKHVELGYALGLGKKILLVGKNRENIFQYGIERVKTWKDAKTILANYASTYSQNPSSK